MTTFQTPGPITAFVEIGSGDINVTASDRVDSVVPFGPAMPPRKLTSRRPQTPP